jgi:hypothetical protein
MWLDTHVAKVAWWCCESKATSDVEKSWLSLGSYVRWYVQALEHYYC